MIVKLYWKKTTTTAKYWEKFPDGIDPPALTFCDNGKLHGHEDDHFDENFIKITNSEDDTPANFQLRPMQTAYRGKCFVVDLQDKVSHEPRT